MSEPQRATRARAKPERSGATTPTRDAAPAGPALAAPAPQWAASHVPAPFALGGVQRKVAIGPAGDAYEREADRVAADVASGRGVAPSAISPIGSLPASPATGQRAMAPDKDKKPEPNKKPEVQKKPEQDRKPPQDRKPEAEKDRDKTPAAVPLQMAAAAPAAPAKDDKKKEEKPKPGPVQKAAAVPPAPAMDEKKKEEKPKPGPVQKAAAPAAPATDDKKKEEKPKTPAPVQKAAAPAAPATDEKKKDEKPKPGPVQKAAAPAAPAMEDKKTDDKKKEEKPKSPAAVQKAAAGSAVQAPGTPKEKDKEKEKDKTVEQKLASAPVQKAAAPPSSPEQESEKGRQKDKDTREKTEARTETRPTAAGRDEQKRRRQGDEEATPMQRAASGAPTPSMESAAGHAIGSKGAGEPMPAGTRQTLESSMGVDLGGVRVHHDGAAHQTADALQARAFTHGSDIWLARNESLSNVPLMAHEATHVVQQAGGVHRMLVQRAKEPPAADEGGNWDFEDPKLGKVRKGSKFLIPTLKVPTVKKAFTPGPVILPKKTDDPRPDDQRTLWEKEARAGTGIDTKLEKKKKDEKAPSLDGGLTYMKLKGRETYVIGDTTAIKNRVLRPYWDQGGKIEFYDVDHQLELQLGGANDIANMWLLQSEANRSSGREIRAEKTEKIQNLLDAAIKKGIWAGEPPTIDTIRQSYTVTFEKVVGGLKIEGEPDKRWTIEEIRDKASQLDPLKALSKKEIEEKGLKGSAETVAIYTNPTGGGLHLSKGWKEDQTEKKETFDWGKMLRVELIKFDHKTKKGSIHGHAFRDPKSIIEQIDFAFDIQDLDSVEYGGYVSAASVTREIQSKLKAKGLSPIQIAQAELTERGIIGRGQLLPSIPLLKDLQIDLVLDGENIYLSKVFSAGDFKFPGPIKVTAASLEVFAGTQGIGARGDVFLTIERVGKGQVTGKASTASGFELEGKFDFDTELFDPASVKVWYRAGEFGGEGKLGIPEGKVKGIKSALLTASFAGDRIEATGTVKPSIPGIEQGDLKFSYDPATGIVVGGRLELKKDIPGIEGGSVMAELSKPPGAEKWKVKAAGEATPKIPGISAKLAVSYDDGAFDAVVVAGYEKGMLKGQIIVGATNRLVGEDGKPAGPPPDKGDKVTIYGGGSVTLKIAPWLQATAGIKILPNGEIEVTGEIGLPSALEIFPEKKLDKNIFKIGIDIPIVGVAVAGQRIGIFANISGGLDLSAGIGPGQLNQLKLAVTYNPAHEENTKVTGDANLHIPAHAGLRLFVRGSLGVGIPIVSASAGIEIGGSLGLEGALDAGVHVEWTPTKGLDLTAQASVYVEPKLKFDITGFVLVEADLWITTIELYSKKWQLASFEYGSGLRFGLKFPIHYQEGKPFDISLSDVEFEVPKIDPGELLSGLIKKVA
jgi:hypothetical protein